MARRRTLDLNLHVAVALMLAGAPLLPVSAARAQAPNPAASTESPRRYDIPAGPLDRTLNRYASEAGVELSVDGALIQGKTSAGMS